MISCLIVDDEPTARDIIRNYIEQTPFLKLSGEADTALQAMDLLKKKTADLIFLDINMSGLTGIQFLKSMSDPPSVILTTAYSEYALEGYELDVVDYLLKPFGFERFLKAVNKVNDGKNGSDGSITIKCDGKLIRVPVSETLYIEGMGDYIRLFTVNERYTVYDTMKSMEQALTNSGFFRIHKSYLVALSHISYVEGNRVTIGEQELPIGKAYKKDFIKRFTGAGS